MSGTEGAYGGAAHVRLCDAVHGPARTPRPARPRLLCRAPKSNTRTLKSDTRIFTLDYMKSKARKKKKKLDKRNETSRQATKITENTAFVGAEIA
eukprot:288117-Rhodomonas_salina.1